MRDASHPTARASDQIVGVVRTHWVLGVCGFCRHEIPCGENRRSTCPGCGSPLDFFPLFRRKHAPPRAATSAGTGRA